MKRLVAAALLLTSSPALGGGMVLPVRGVRTLARAGAYVAGAEDADALWQDPAGLAHLAGDNRRTLLFDAAFVYQTVEHAPLDSSGNPLPAVTNQQPGQPIPTIAGALGIGDRLVIAGGLTAPYTALHRYSDGGPQRYASVSLTSSTFVLVTAGVAYRISDRLRVGATVQDVISRVSSQIVVSGCPGATACAPEDPQYDALVTLEQTDYLAPSGSIGIQYDAAKTVTVGLSIQAPARVSGRGTLDVKLPTAAVFQGAEVTGDQASLSFTLPPAIRAGVELRPTKALRFEAAIDVELWSVHDEMVIAPDGVRIEGAPGDPAYTLGRMVIPRHYRTSYSPSIAIEWHGPNLMLGAGYAYETAAAPPAYVSVLTVDAAKHLVGIGGGYEADGWQIGAAAGFVAVADVDVPAASAGVPQLAPIRDQPSSLIVNAGTYRSSYLVAGLRFARHW